MPDAGLEASVRKEGIVWFGLAIAITFGGMVAGGTYAVVRFPEIAGFCGVVRFYEFLLAGGVLGMWFASAATGMGLATYGYLRGGRSLVAGVIVAAMANLGMVVLCVFALIG